MEIRYEEISLENVGLLKELQTRIFPESSFEKGFDLLMEQGPSAFGNIMQTYFIAFADDEPAGIYGLYIPEGVEAHHSIWLGWYGILPAFRGKGIGKRILLDSMDHARAYAAQYGVRYYRLYTSETVNDSAQPLYNKVMDLKEYYKHPEMFTDEMIEKTRRGIPGKTEEEYRSILAKAIAIFSKSLFENEILVPWDSYYMSLKKTTEMEKDYTRSPA